MLKENQNLISVIIPVYNTELYIAPCLDSILNNTYQNLQVICVNDGSTDGSLEILKEYSNKDSRVTVINKENGGVSSARNAGLELAEGEYISFVDSDDVILPEYYEYLMEIMTESRADIIDSLKGSKINVPVEKNYSVMDRYGMAKNKSMRSYVIGKIYTKSIIGSNRFTEGVPIHEDCVFNMSIIKDCIKRKRNIRCVLMNCSMYLYTSRSDSAIHQQTWQKNKIAASCFKSVLETEEDPEIVNIYAIECIRKSLPVWYDQYLRGYASERKKTEQEMRKVSKKIKPTDNYTWKEIVKFKILACFPRLYRRFRILDDPTMKQYEDSVRKSDHMI